MDIATARNAGMDCVSVTWGFRTVEELQAAGAAAMINRPEELLALIETSGKMAVQISGEPGNYCKCAGI